MRATEIDVAGQHLIRYFENFKPVCYKTHLRAREGTREFEDVPTIGYGHTGMIVDPKTGVRRKLTLDDVGKLRIDEAYAFELLVEDIAEADKKVDRYFPGIPLTQGQRNALGSLAFNIRQKWLASQYTLADLVLSQTWTPISLVEAFILYRNPRTGVEKGLYRRRLAEALEFLGLPWEPAKVADLRRDARGEIKYITEPKFVLLQAENLAAGQTILAGGDKEVTPAPKPSAPAPLSSSKARPTGTQAPAAAKPSAEPLPPRVVVTPDPEPAAAPQPTVQVEPLPPPRKPHSKNSVPAKDWGIDPDAPLKPAEESETVEGVGIETEARKILDAMRVLLPTSSVGAIVAWLEKASWVGFAVAGVILLTLIASVYLVRKHRGQAMKRRGRERASQAVR